MILIIDDDFSGDRGASASCSSRPGRDESIAPPVRGAWSCCASSGATLVLQDMNFSRRTAARKAWSCSADQGACGRRCRHPDHGLGFDRLAVQGMKAGAADFISKPWRDEQMLRAGATALDLVASRAAPGRTA